MRIRIFFLACVVSLGLTQLDAAVTLPRVISDHMVFQRGAPVRVWGTASPGEEVAVKFRGRRVSARADGQGQWEVFLGPLTAGGPDDMRIDGDNTVVVKDILVGEVWVASGQSNMQFSLSRAVNAEKEIAAAKYPRLRLFQVKRETAETPQEDVQGEWRQCTPQSAEDFSAVGYFFGRKLLQNLQVPVGIIHSSWGGTPAEAWTSREALRADSELWFYLREWDDVMAAYPAAMVRYERAHAKWEKQAAKAKASGAKSPREPRRPRGPDNPHRPATLYNAMIAPLVPYGIRGAIWYQGESNAGANEAFRYRRLFAAMIEDWRARWGVGEFPFLFVQLANFETSADWPVLRESQTETLHLRHTGMAVTTDIGNPTDIHPRNKQDVGKRLALWALAETYGKKLVYSGPLYRQMAVDGSKAQLYFDHTGSGLKAAGGSLNGFVIAGPDHVFHAATAKIKGKSVVVSSPEVSAPKAVRYAWENNPENTLRNSANLPASPFRTDRWRDGRMPK